MSTSKTVARVAGALVVLSMLSFGPARADIFISELCDPRLDYASDRFIEIYNPADVAVDLTGWDLVAVANGVDAFTWHLSGTIGAHQALVAGDATTVAVFPVAFPDEGWSGANGNWNGRVGDGARLVNPLGSITDSMVAAGTAFENCDYVRKPEITAPNPFTAPTEWTSTPVERATNGSPGVHDTALPPAGPVIDAIRTSPAWPTIGDAVHVLADVTATGASITAVTLAWGMSPSALTNAIDMALVSGDTYQTVTPIPPQAGGSTVHYQITADNDLPATAVSEVRSYTLPFAVTVHEIQGEASASPYDGLTVITHGLVTARYGAVFVIQDGAGAWNGLWARGATAPAPGDSVTITGRVTESDAPANIGNTMLVNAQVVSATPGAALPDPVPVSTAAAGAEAYEGVLVQVTNAVCTDHDLGAGEWQADDGSGGIRVGVLGGAPGPTLGTTYAVTGPLGYGAGQFKIEPRDAADLAWTADHVAPVVFQVAALNETTLRVIFSETVQPASASRPGNYDIPGLTVSGATRDLARPDQALLTLSSPMATDTYTLTVTGVADLYGNVTAGAGAPFSYYSPGIPAGYYDAAAGLGGDALRSALHEIIRNHTARSYDYAWTAFTTTDVRPDNGKVWDIYSDVPGGVPPYLYDFGVDQGGVGGAEGTGYTREHTWCKNWFGGEVSPMYSDIFILYPCDTHVNGTRGVNPYGETAAPQWVSLNGSRVGPSAVPGYTGTVFEPIDAFKGDLARVYFYFSTRYYTEDAGWPGGPAMDGSTLKPWAVAMFLEWDDTDPVSQKEIDRNNAIYAIQGNRNPFVDRPDFADLVFGETSTGVDEGRPAPALPARAALCAARPNPFNPATTISFELAQAGKVSLAVYDVAGRRVRVLLDETRAAGRHDIRWDGRADSGQALGSGVYFCRMEAGLCRETKRVTLLK